MIEEVEPHNDTENPNQHTIFFLTGGLAIPMTALGFALIGFAVGLFTMSIISLYNYVVKKMSR